MGWSFSYTDGKKEVIQDCLTGGESPKGFKVLAHSVVGNHLWVAFENETSERYPVGDRFLCLYLLAGGGRNMGWGCKAISEDMGPCDVDCPLYLLDLVPAPKDSEYSANFRARVRAFHVAKAEGRKKKANLEVGDKLMLPEGCRPSWVIITEAGKSVRGIADGARYRISPRYITNGTIIKKGTF